MRDWRMNDSEKSETKQKSNVKKTHLSYCLFNEKKNIIE